MLKAHWKDRLEMTDVELERDLSIVHAKLAIEWRDSTEMVTGIGPGIEISISFSLRGSMSGSDLQVWPTNLAVH